MSKRRRFFGLTAKQADAVGQIAFMGGPVHPATAKVLLEKGLITATKRTMRDRMGEYTVTEYDVPLAINMAYCYWCSELGEPAGPSDLDSQPSPTQSAVENAND